MGLSELYNTMFEEKEMEKQAEAEKLAEAEQEYEEMTKIAQDYESAGRFMARGYTDEMEKIAGKMGFFKKVVKEGAKGGNKVKKEVMGAVKGVKKFYTPKSTKKKVMRGVGTAGLFGAGVAAGRASKD